MILSLRLKSDENSTSMTRPPVSFPSEAFVDKLVKLGISLPVGVVPLSRFGRDALYVVSCARLSPVADDLHSRIVNKGEQRVDSALSKEA